MLLLLVAAVCATPSLGWPMQYALNENQINKPFADRLFQGDIMLPPRDLAAAMGIRSKRAAGNMFARKWNKNQPIGFFFNSTLSDEAKTLIRATIVKITANTCLSFKENSGVGTQIEFSRFGGCWSMVGETPMNGGKQPISIDTYCELEGNIAHEIFHALGVSHTHQRTDRDSYITVNMDLIASNQRVAYDKLSTAENNNFDVPYEYGSVMHYGADEKIVINQPGYENTIGNRMAATFNDYKMVNRLYSCSDHCSKQMSCQNGGYPSPKDCNACICHQFYTGSNCQTPRNEITITASSPSAKTTFHQDQNNAIFGNMDQDKYGRDGPKIIRAPEGRKIRVTFSEMSANNGKFKNCEVACQYLGVEIVDNQSGDLSTMGKLFCCPTLAGTSFMSQSNVIGYKAYIAPGWNTDIVVTYSLV